MQYSTQAYIGTTYTVSTAINGALVNGAARTGTLSLVEGTTTLVSVDITQVSPNSSGYYALSVPGGLPAGANSLKVVYSGDANYLALTSTLATVTSASDFLGLSYTGSVLVGQPYTVGVSILTGTTPVNPAPTGTLTLMSGTTPLASLNITGVGAENGDYTLGGADRRDGWGHSLSVVYSGDSNYSSATASLTDHRCDDVVDQPRRVLQHGGVLWPGVEPQRFDQRHADHWYPATGTLTLSEGGNVLASVNVATTTPNSGGYIRSMGPADCRTRRRYAGLCLQWRCELRRLTSTITINLTNDFLAPSYPTSVVKVRRVVYRQYGDERHADQRRSTDRHAVLDGRHDHAGQRQRGDDHAQQQRSVRPDVPVAWPGLILT